MPGTTHTIEPTSERQRAQLRDHAARYRQVQQLTREKIALERDLAQARSNLRRAWVRTAKQKRRAEMWRARAMK